MIFHVPYRPNPLLPSGGGLRPFKMIDAFQKIGFSVDAVIGGGHERRRQIKAIKKKIEEGNRYRFLYSESSSMPTLLTETHHLPIYPFLDFGFFRFCKKSGIPIGLFYRDIHWCYEHYPLRGIKKSIAGLFYRYDLKQYEALVDLLFLPSLKMAENIPFQFNMKMEELPPGSESSLPKTAGTSDPSKLNLLYVGGVDDLHDCRVLFQAASKREYFQLAVACRDDVWRKSGSDYPKGDNIKILNRNEDELAPLYDSADLVSLFVKPTPYWAFAMPYKLFEYLGRRKPIVAVKRTAAGNFVEKYDIGWSIPYDIKELLKLTDTIMADKNILDEKIKNIDRILNQNSWEMRAKKVAALFSSE